MRQIFIDALIVIGILFYAFCLGIWVMEGGI
jgi:hypothetical protein